MPVYTGAMTSLIIRETLKKEGVRNVKVHRIKRSDTLRIDGVRIQTFPMTHAFPDTFGVAIHTDQGYVVYTGEFIIDYDMMQEEYNCDLNLLSEFGKKGVLALMCESQGVERNGHTSPNHRITQLIEPIIESHRDGRILISTYFQSLFRIQEILDVAIKYRKKIFIHDEGLRHIVKLMEEMKYYTVPNDLLIDRKHFSNDMEDVLVIISGQGKNLFRTMSNIANQEDKYVRFRSSDTIIIASPIVSGTQTDANNMENEIYKEGGTIFTLDSKQVLSMHPSREDLKMMLYLFKPKYYIPVKGEYRHLYMNATLATTLLANLLKNAFVHTADGGKIIVSITETTITVSNTAEHGPLDGRRIFDRFYQGSKKEGSTGLGLAVVKAIATLYGMEISYFHNEGMHNFRLTTQLSGQQ